jgi:phage repressor protein C with HTH and peptisase S24 domain
MENLVSERLTLLVEALANGNEKRFAESIGVKPAVINNYTTGKQQSKPGFEVLSKILDKYPQTNIDWLITGYGTMLKTDKQNGRFQVIVSTQDTTGNLVVPVINRKAAANYLAGYQTQEFFEQLDSINLPSSFKKGLQSYALQISGDSMQPTLLDGDFVICSLCEASDWEYLSDGEICVVVSEKGLQVKRIRNQLRTQQNMVFISDNKLHPPFVMHAEEIQQLWKVNYRLSSKFADDHEGNSNSLDSRVSILESKVEKLERKFV